MPHFINKNCTKCGACAAECPSGSISEGKDTFVIDSDTCTDHSLCAAVCPTDAIEMLSIKKRKGPNDDSGEEEEEEEEEEE